MNLPEMSRVALTATQTAGRLLVDMRRHGITVTERRGIDFTTKADLSSEALITNMLQHAYPSIPLYGEEARGEIPEHGAVWVVDPLDGTDNYAGNRGPFGVSIALVENCASVMGTVFFPLTEETYQGYTGFLSGFQTTGMASVSKETELKNSTVWTDWSKQPSDVTLALLQRLIECSRYPSIRMCATHALMMVATGAIEGYACHKLAPEDHAAAGLLVQLAGGTITNMHGDPWTPLSESIVATNGLIHEELLDAISDVV